MSHLAHVRYFRNRNEASVLYPENRPDESFISDWSTTFEMRLWPRDLSQSSLDVVWPLLQEYVLSKPTHLLTGFATEVIHEFQWRQKWDGSIIDSTGCFISRTLNDAAIAMLDLGWVAVPPMTLDWERIPEDPDVAANDMRVFLDVDGRAYVDPFPRA